MNNPMKEMYEALQGVQHYSKKAMEAIQKMGQRMGQRGGSGNSGGGYSGGSSGGSMGQRDEWEGMFGQRNDMELPPWMM